MKDDKAEGAEFLRRLGILIMGLGALAAVGMIYAGVEAKMYDYVFYGAGLLIVCAILYGFCVNLASINRNIQRLYLLKSKELNILE